MADGEVRSLADGTCPDNCINEDEDCYYDDDDDYVYEEEDEDGDGLAATSVDQLGSSDIDSSNIRCGLKFDGNLSEIMSTSTKNAIYPVYKQLAEFCTVDVEDNFFSAQVTIYANDQYIIVQIEFPQQSPFFPDAPPTIELKSKFRPPFQHFNIIFNHHPQLLAHKWNLCTDIIQIVRDIIEAGKSAVVELYDDDDESTFNYREVIRTLQESSIDITGLFPDAQFSSLPSFGILKEREAAKPARHSGIGYSSRGSSHSSKSTKGWDIHSLNQKRMEDLLRVATALQQQALMKSELANSKVAPLSTGKTYNSRSSKSKSSSESTTNCATTTAAAVINASDYDSVLVDTIWFVVDELLSDTITMEEFFRSLPLYVAAVRCLLALPAAAAHITAPAGLLRVHQQISSMGASFKESLESHEIVALQQLETLCCRSQKASGRKRQLQAEGVESSSNKNSSCNNSSSSDVGSSARAMSICDSDAGAVNSNSNGDSSSGSGAAKYMAVGEGISSGSSCYHHTRSKATAMTHATNTTGTNSNSNSNSNHSNGSNGSSKEPTGKGANGSHGSEATSSSAAAVKSSVDETESGISERVIRLEEGFRQHQFKSSLSTVSHLPSKWMRRLNIELASMPDSLPNNVLVFSGIECSQPSLMKVLMFPESVDTPYCGGCFEFDMFIGANYPHEAPKMLLVTTGGGSVRFNPNLYNCGKVCLSLLGTWPGESWDPAVSSLTQVINSILFLIFVEDPYFNEPGYEMGRGTASGDRQSRSYNANIRIQTLRFAYLEHFKRKSAQLSDWILPQLRSNWRSKGKRTAEGWLAELPGAVPSSSSTTSNSSNNSRSSSSSNSSSSSSSSSSSFYPTHSVCATSDSQQRIQLTQLIQQIDEAVEAYSSGSSS